MTEILQDFRFALRSLRRAPGFTLTALLTLGIGIGVAAAMFGISRQVLLAPLPYKQPDRLVALSFHFPGAPASTSQVGSAADFIRRYARSYESVGVSDGGPTGVNVADPSAARGYAFPVQQLRISHDFLPTLGIYPRLGRGFSADEDRSGGPRAALLSDRMWRTLFAADPNIVGHLVHIDREDVPVIGVLPAGVLADMQGGTRETSAAGIFQPLQMSPKDEGYDGTNYAMIGRLRDGVSQQQAQLELGGLLPEFARQNAWYSRWTTRNGNAAGLDAFPLRAALAGDVRGSLLLLLCAAAAVLLIACLNLAGMMVARTAARTRELAVRSALGAGRAALLRLLLAESAMLAVAGAALGLLVSRVAAQAFVLYAPLDMPRLQPAAALWPLAIAAAGLAGAGMLLFGLLPASVILGREVNSGLRNDGSQGQSRTYHRAGRMLIVAQVSLTFVLLMAASLLLHTFLAMRAIAPGFATEHVTIGQVTLKGDSYGRTERYASLTARVVEQLVHTPGVRAAGAVNGLPLDRGLNNGGWPTGRKDQSRSIETRFVSPNYLRTIGIAVLRGRGLGETDNASAPRVTVISQAMAKCWWPDGDALGNRINIGNSGDYEIVGIARDTKESSLLEQSRPIAYVAIPQITNEFSRMINNWFATTFVVRAADGVDVGVAMASAVRNADPELPLTRVETMQDVVDASMAAPRFFGSMATSVAAFTLLLAAVGLFGLLSYQVTQQTRDIGVRMALGATRGDVLRSVLTRGVLFTGTGLLIGALLSTGLPQLLSGSVAEFAVLHASAHAVTSELAAGLLAALLLFTATIAACYIPARRASTIDPVSALRAE